MSTIVVTGADGFVGRHVIQAARRAGHSVWGITRREFAHDDEILNDLERLAVADLRTEWPADFFGDAVVHLAGLSTVGASFARPQDYIDGNSAMVTTMCEAHLASGAPARIVGVSSGSVYGSSSRPLVESSPTKPTSPYVVSKLLVETQLEYYRIRGLRTSVARPFNHVGPGQRRGFLIPDLTARVRALAPGETLVAGDLSARRDYTDVRDVADAYIRLCVVDEPPALVNVASGQSRSGLDILELVCEALDREMPEVTTDPALLRPSEIREVTGDASLLRTLGWETTIPLRRSIAEFVADSVDAAETPSRD